MKVAFVGASGIVGHQVVPFLTYEFELSLFGLQAQTLEVGGQTLQIAALDILDFAACEAALAGHDAVVNCAAKDHHGHDARDAESLRNYNEGCIEVNVRGSYHLYEAAKRSDIRNFVFVSSLTTQFGLPRHARVNADSAVRPVDIYACTKLFGDQTGQLYASRDWLDVKCLRLGQPFPAFTGDDESWPHEESRWRSAMVAVEDIARAIAAALRADSNYGVYPIVSLSDGDWIDPHAAREIGFEPIYKFEPLRLSRDGVEVRSWAPREVEATNDEV